MYIRTYYLHTFVSLKGHNTHYSGHLCQHFEIEKTIAIQLVRPTEVSGQV